MAACCFLGVDLRNWFDHNFHSRFTDGTLHSSSDLLYSSLLLFFTRTIFSICNSLSPCYSLGRKFSKTESSSLLSSDKIIRSPIFLPTYLRTQLFYIKIHSFLCSSWIENSRSKSKLEKFSKSSFLPDSKKSLFLLTHNILLPLESKHCPLTPASVHACADSVDELRFRNKS